MLEVWCSTQKSVSHCLFMYLMLHVWASQIISSFFCLKVSMTSSFCCWTSIVCTPPSSKSSISALQPLREEQPISARKLRWVSKCLRVYDHVFKIFKSLRLIIGEWRWDSWASGSKSGDGHSTQGNSQTGGAQTTSQAANETDRPQPGSVLAGKCNTRQDVKGVFDNSSTCVF